MLIPKRVSPQTCKLSKKVLQNKQFGHSNFGINCWQFTITIFRTKEEHFPPFRGGRTLGFFSQREVAKPNAYSLSLLWERQKAPTNREQPNKEHNKNRVPFYSTRIDAEKGAATLTSSLLENDPGRFGFWWMPFSRDLATRIYKHTISFALTFQRTRRLIPFTFASELTRKMVQTGWLPETHSRGTV